MLQPDHPRVQRICRTDLDLAALVRWGGESPDATTARNVHCQGLLSWLGHPRVQGISSIDSEVSHFVVLGCGAQH